MGKFGLSTALLTPFDEGGHINVGLLSAHVSHVLGNGADSVTLFGTTGEGASLSLSERSHTLEALLDAGCPPSKLIVAIYATSVLDAAGQVDDAFQRGIRKFLLVPPFYFKGCSDSGLFAWHTELLAATDQQAKFVLYHIPQVTGISLSVELIHQLYTVSPHRILAIKDSSGSWSNARALFAQSEIPVLVGDERLLHQAVALGSDGAISGMANLYPARLKRILRTAEEDKALSAEVTNIITTPVIPALKVLLATASSEPAWERVRAPLSLLSQAERSSVLSTRDELV